MSVTQRMIDLALLEASDRRAARDPLVAALATLNAERAIDKDGALSESVLRAAAEASLAQETAEKAAARVKAAAVEAAERDRLLALAATATGAERTRLLAEAAEAEARRVATEAG